MDVFINTAWMRFPLHPPKNKGFHSRQLLLCKKSIPPKVVMSIKSEDQEDFKHISVLHFLVLLLLRHPSVCSVGLNFGPAFGHSWLGSFFISDPLFNGEGFSWQLFLQERIFLTHYSCSIKRGKTGSNKRKPCSFLFGSKQITNVKTFIGICCPECRYLVLLTDYPADISSLQLHHGSLGDLQQDVRCRDPAADREVPGVTLLLPDGCWPARWRVRRCQTCNESALLPQALLRSSGQWTRWQPGGGRGGDIWQRGAPRLGVRGIYGVLWELWWRYRMFSNFRICIPVVCGSTV